MEWIAFASEIPDDLPITKELVEKTRAEAKVAGQRGLNEGLALAGLSVAALLSGIAELERQVIDLRKSIAAEE
ncbi:hypothetical protein AFM11_08385 [Mycolicibacterium wolinskyi]|uniref:Uncharacterized protein n=1 Tax=Mycolicibacterium wolinskyi TaxID=59750 RepID=A0A132PRL3_9MYCO|nr:hypothetical protein [Mycolicibacterium wolinskyi]KWX24682.1 hypothetical protein AFM11_08385 [Mycolicibacterium wolinskyi]